MHQTRQATTTKMPIPRKGTKYIARASSHVLESVSVLAALRDILHLAKTMREVRQMIFKKLLKINGREVKDYHESIKLFNILHADKDYVLKLSPVRKFFFEEVKNPNERLCKIVSKKVISGNKIQLNLHDGSNVIADKKFKIGDSLYIDFLGKIKKHISPEKGREVFILSGKYAGQSGKIESVEGRNISVKFKDKSALLELSQAVIL
jgi:small subunit ribosomal protein S4e